MEDILKNVYYSSDGYGGIRKLYKAGKKLWPKLTVKQTKEWLQSQPTYTIHSEQNRKPIRRKYWAPGPMIMLESDLGFMRGASSNHNRPGFLLCIDIFSRYIYQNNTFWNYFDKFQIHFCRKHQDQGNQADCKVGRKDIGRKWSR